MLHNWTTIPWIGRVTASKCESCGTVRLVMLGVTVYRRGDEQTEKEPPCVLAKR